MKSRLFRKCGVILLRGSIVLTVLGLMVAGGCSKTSGSQTTSTTLSPSTQPITTTNPVPTTSPLPTTSVPPTATSTSTTTASGYVVRVYWGMSYVPDSITVPVGNTVTMILVNGPDPDHPLGFDPPISWSSGYSGKDFLLTYTFTKAGTYRFYCTIHGNSGTIIVV